MENDTPKTIRAWSVLVAMPKGDPRPPRWITMLCTTDDETEAFEYVDGIFTVERVIDIRRGAM